MISNTLCANFKYKNELTGNKTFLNKALGSYTINIQITR